MKNFSPPVTNQNRGKFIDDAQLSGLKQILIIHGKGTGATLVTIK
ncbi:MAG: Smr/MutS family protein [Selenomonadaceae bacterium]|nr:Smr/MutS family protein [Selenomonadaceae bacterium]MBQ9497656.1 Smr/MutS family protein [Selenomonadaceae bacterium]